MQKHLLFLIAILLVSLGSKSQTAISPTNVAPDPKAMLEVIASDKGLLLPRVDLQTVGTGGGNLAAANPEALLVYNTNLSYGSGKGYYYWNGSAWERLQPQSSAGTVTNVSVTTANGVSGTVSNATSTPAISLSLGNITPTSVAASGTVTGSNISGTNTGDQTITLTGDVTGSGTGSFATTLATVNTATPGTYGSATTVPVITVNGKGLVTASSSTTISGVAPAGAAGGGLTGNYPNPTIAANAVGSSEITDASVANADLTNSSVTINTGTGLSGGGNVALGGTLNLTNTGVVTASNGLTVASNDVKLGGPLTANTTITQDAAEALTIDNTGTANTTINLTSTGDFDVQDNGSSALFVRDDARVGINTNSPNTSLDVRTTDAIQFPSGTTAQRPSTPTAGFTRYNSENKALEFFDGTNWISANQPQVPIGTIAPYGGSTPPTGWLFCDGSAVSRTTYLDLFNALSTSYGAGDGSTTFNLPDLRGKSVFGLGGSAPYNVLGATGGALTVTPSLTPSLTAAYPTFSATLPNHTHSIPAHTHGFSSGLTGTGFITGNNSVSHTHSVTIDPAAFNTSDGAGSHQHNIGIRGNDGGWAAGNPNAFHNGMSSGGGGTSTSDRGATSNANTGIILSAGGHNHSIDVPSTTVTSGTQSANHTHTIPQLSVTGTVGTGSSADGGALNTGTGTNPAITITAGGSSTAVSGTVTSNTVNTYDPFQVANYIIKATNATSPSIIAINPSGVLGQTLYNNGTNWVATSNLYNAGNNVGIGTTNPTSLLAIGVGSPFQVNTTGAIAAATGITSSGTTTLSGLNTNGLVRTTGTNGVLSIGQAANADIATGAITDVKVTDVNWSKITNRPTTLAGYGVTDAILNQTSQQASSNFNISGTGTIGALAVIGTGDGTGSPVGGNLRAPNGGTGNTAGASLNVNAGFGFGAGAGGSVFINGGTTGSGTNGNVYLRGGNSAGAQGAVYLNDNNSGGTFLNSAGGIVTVGSGTPGTAQLNIQNGLALDRGNLNNGSINASNGTPTGNGLTFGASSGEGVASNRANATAGQNQFGVDLYTASIRRLSITNGGNVGINNTNPGYRLDVNGNTLIQGGLYTQGTASTLYGTNASIYANQANALGGGLMISDDGGFFDYNNGPVTFNGSTGLTIAGNNGSASSNAYLRVNQLAGNGNRPLYADANGTLTTAGRASGSTTTNTGTLGGSDWIDYVSTGTMAVANGEFVEISGSVQLNFTGGSGNDRFVITVKVNNSSGCSSTSWRQITTFPEGDHNGSYSYPFYQVWSPTCTGTVNYSINIGRFNADDTWVGTGGTIVAVKK